LYHAEDLPFAIKDIPDVLPILEKTELDTVRVDGPPAITLQIFLKCTTREA
jgi:hypothetical protein